MAHFYSESLGADHSAVGECGTEAGYRRDTINTLGENPRPVIVFYRPQNDSLYKEATFFGLDFGKLEMAINMQGRLIRTDAQAETDEEGWQDDGSRRAEIRRTCGQDDGDGQGKPRQDTEAGPSRSFLRISLDVGDDEYIELAAERRSDPAEDEEGEPVQEENASPCVEGNLQPDQERVRPPVQRGILSLAEDTEELLKDLKEVEQEIRQKWEESPKQHREKKNNPCPIRMKPKMLLPTAAVKP